MGKPRAFPLSLASGKSPLVRLSLFGFGSSELGIAEQYANYTWTATSTNVWHASTSSYGNGETTEPGINPAYPPPHSIVSAAAEMIETPDEGYFTGGWKADGTDNIGVPYAAGGSTTIDKVALPTSADRGLSFIEKLGYGFPAGDISGALSDVGSNWYTNGVDCVGLIERAWQLGARDGMSKLKTDHSSPIRFRDLQPGDILMDLTNHVMLFDKFDPPLMANRSRERRFGFMKLQGKFGR